MILNICNSEYDTKDIKGITIKDTRIFLDLTYDFKVLTYSNKSEIKDAEKWLYLQNITSIELDKAIDTILTICEYHLNTKEQCSECPLTNLKGCKLSQIPMNWRKV